jgi:sigma-B regulation protein RsbU (phosphoserine phosphatase)
MRILIAEDERITRMTLARQLQSWGHEVTSAEDGHQAWAQFEASRDVDIVITDWEMPGVSGLELVQRIRQTPRPVYTYVIILTSRAEKSDIVSGIEAGADDYVSKPFDRDELRVRLLAGERIVRLERALNRQNAELRDANERIRRGLEAAARVQRSMLPKANVETQDVRTAWKYVPTDELAGDAIGLHLIDDRYLVAYVLDVSGHGVPAALLSVSAMHALEPEPADSSLLRCGNGNRPAVEGGHLGTVQRPARIATELNRRFRAGEHDGRYLTMVLCVLDTLEGRAQIVCAGHPPPILLRAGQEQPVPDEGGFPVGIFDEAEYCDGTVQLRPGDRLCLFSDGVIEQNDCDNKEQFGRGRIASGLSRRGELPVTDAAPRLIGDLDAWAGSSSFIDDVSLVLVEWTGGRVCSP